MTPTTVRMVLVEGEKADGIIVDHDVFGITANEDSATAAEQVVAAVLGTQESAVIGGHHLKSIGITWSEHTDASAVRDALAAHGIGDVMLVSELHAAGALAQAVGRAVGYETTALFLIDRDTATLSVVRTDDGSVVKVLSRSLHSADAMAVLAEMAASVDEQESPPQGMFVVGSGVDVSSVKAHLEHLVSLPVNAPDESELALARGAALAAATAPAFEASTVGLAYSQDPDATTAGSEYARLAAAETQLAPASADSVLLDDVDPDADAPPVDEGRKPFLLVGSALTSIFVVGVVALVISLAVSIRPTVDQRPSPGESAILPSTPAAAAPPAVHDAPPAQPAPPAPQAPAPAPPAQTIQAPIPVVQEAPAPLPQAPRTVYVQQAPAPAPKAALPAPAPAAPPVDPAPPAAPPPAPIPAQIPAPVPAYTPPAPPPLLQPPAREYPQYPPQQAPRWVPPWQRQQPQYPQYPAPAPYNPPQQQYPQYPPQSPYAPPNSGGYGRGGDGGYGGSGGSGGSGGYGPGSGSGSEGGPKGPTVCIFTFCTGR
jgi:hypothetical protein